MKTEECVDFVGEAREARSAMAVGGCLPALAAAAVAAAVAGWLLWCSVCGSRALLVTGQACVCERCGREIGAVDAGRACRFEGEADYAADGK